MSELGIIFAILTVAFVVDIGNDQPPNGIKLSPFIALFCFLAAIVCGIIGAA